MEYVGTRAGTSASFHRINGPALCQPREHTSHQTLKRRHLRAEGPESPTRNGTKLAQTPFGCNTKLLTAQGKPSRRKRIASSIRMHASRESRRREPSAQCHYLETDGAAREPMALATGLAGHNFPAKRPTLARSARTVIPAQAGICCCTQVDVIGRSLGSAVFQDRRSWYPLRACLDGSSASALHQLHKETLPLPSLRLDPPGGG